MTAFALLTFGDTVSVQQHRLLQQQHEFTTERKRHKPKLLKTMKNSNQKYHQQFAFWNITALKKDLYTFNNVIWLGQLSFKTWIREDEKFLCQK